MKKCPVCGKIYSSDVMYCPTCSAARKAQEPQEPQASQAPSEPQEPQVSQTPSGQQEPQTSQEPRKPQEPKEPQIPNVTIWDMLAKYIKFILPAVLIIGFILGFGIKSCTGIKKTDYNSLLAEKDTLLAEKDTLNEQIDQINKEYSAYKEKMQPYEDVQLADAQNKVEADKLKAEQEKQALAEKQAAEKKAAEEEKARKEAEEKAAAEAKAAEEAKGYETGITFDNLARTPDDYKGKKVKFSGKVIQVIEGTTETQIRFAINGDYDRVIFCRIPKAKTASTRILEDDYIHIMGVSNGLISYQSTLGGTITIPDVSVDDWGPGR